MKLFPLIEVLKHPENRFVYQSIEGRLKPATRMTSLPTQNSVMRFRTKSFASLELDGGQYTRRQYTSNVGKWMEVTLGSGLLKESAIMSL